MKEERGGGGEGCVRKEEGRVEEERGEERGLKGVEKMGAVEKEERSSDGEEE